MSEQKTPISQMNELCKPNNIAPVYDVVEESGPPHEKTFKVQLTLANVGTYEGIAKSIKAAKHKAAAAGLETCGLTKPLRKARFLEVRPSVELNSLAMKLGKLVEYQDISSYVSQHPGPVPVPSNAYSQMSQYGSSQFKSYDQTTAGMPPYRRPQTKMRVSVRVGEMEFLGEGFRRKEARHNAAKNALTYLLKEAGVECEGTNEESLVEDSVLEKELPAAPVQNESKSSEVILVKSEISKVYEIASRRKLKIDFDVVSSTGPPHNRLFVTTVTVGEFQATGEGSSKKAAKYEASVNILEELQQLPPCPKPPSKRHLYNHRPSQKPTKELDPSMNPISLLGQLRQRRKESPPVYALIAEEGVRNKEFTIQVVVDTHTARGSGANKKEAKKSAAEAMLVLLGVRHIMKTEDAGIQDANVPDHLVSASNNDGTVASDAELSKQAGQQLTICAVKLDCVSDEFLKNCLLDELINNNGSTREDAVQLRQSSGVRLAIKKGHFYSLFQGKKGQEDEKLGDKGGEGRQLPPGLLPILPEMTGHSIGTQTKSITSHSAPVPVVNYTNSSDSVQGKQSGPTITVLNRAPGAPVGKPLSDEILQNGSTPSMKKLEQLAESGGFQVHYQDSTQENEQYLAVVTVSTVPQLVCRGFGTSTLDEAFEHAAANALVHLLQQPSSNGQVVNGAGQRNIHQSGEEPSNGQSIV